MLFNYWDVIHLQVTHDLTFATVRYTSTDVRAVFNIIMHP
jgi:hypothetical protein